MFVGGGAGADTFPFWRSYEHSAAGLPLLPSNQTVTPNAIAVTATLPDPSVSGGAGLPPYAVAETTSTTSTSTTFADAVTISSGSLTAGHEYLVIARCSRRMSVNTISAKHRVEVGGSEVSGSLSIYRPDAANEDMVDYFWHGIVTPTSGQSIAISHALASGSDTLTTKDAILTVLDLNQLTVNTDYKTAVTTTDQTISQTGSANADFIASIKETLNWTPGTASEDWLIFWTASVLHGGGTGASHFLRARASYDDETFVPTYPSHPANSTADIHQYGGFFVREAVAASAHKTEIQLTVGSSSHTAKYTRVTALRLNAFAAHVVTQATSGSETSGWQNLIAADHTPSVADDYIILGYTQVDNAGSSVTAINNRITLEGTVVPTSWANGTIDVNPGATSFADIEIHQVALEAFASGSVQDVDLDLNADNTVATIGYHALAVFSMSLGSTSQSITPNPIVVTATLPSPSVAPGSVSVTPNAITVTAALPSPSLTYQIAANPIANPATLPDPTVTPGSVAVTANAIAVTVTLPNPTVTPGSVTATLGAAISNPATLPDPTVTLAQTVAANAISNPATLPDPTVTPGSVNVAPDPIAVTAVLPAPAVSHTVAVTPIVVTAVLPAPVVTAAQTVVANAIAVSAVLPDPTVTPGAVSVTLAAPIVVTATLPDPSVAAGATSVTLDAAIAVSVVLPAPTVIPPPSTVVANAIAVTPTLPSPTVTPGSVTITLDAAIGVSAALPPPTVTPGAAYLAPTPISITAALLAPYVFALAADPAPQRLTVREDGDLDWNPRTTNEPREGASLSASGSSSLTARTKGI